MKTCLKLLLLIPLLCSCGIRDQEPPVGMGGEIRPANSIFVISPYRFQGTWVFDDLRVGLFHEPFVAGMPEIIDKLVEDIPDANKGFRLLFSAAPFPGHTVKFVWRRAEASGNWYYCEKYDSEGWLCPALLKYFKKAPKEIYVKVEAKQK